ncbi:hypothetical protein BGZ61DRAFT_471601 [Ilyonectria robusta]|uniref:uncharacterized protein n=1 Tax=Ilyonectria robusta TaxID=1079257 RepID=UPI001E8D11F9|nr:uncharacterized protein BGZ61DRAFT_471601 [Ilyonectria robusta]KAH8738259.1 hypothetical protein BGZ61DRAFT_471601 [Ilyonectria robusta]
MDGLPATAAIAGLLAVSGIAIDVLWDLNTSPKAATAVFNLALREVKESRSSIQALHKTLSLLESRQVPFPGRASWIEVDELVATLTDAVLAFSKLYALCSAVEAEAARSSPEEASRRYEKRMKALCARIRWHNLSIAMIMTIINCPAETDAKNSRDELAHRITRLLTFNIGLASRMQRGITPMGASYAGAAMSPSPSPPASISSASASASASAAAPLPSISAAHPSGIAKFATAAAPPPSDSEVGRTPRSVPGWPATFSGYTLADTAFLSYVRLPVSAGELRGDRDFYPGAYAPQTGYEFGGGSVLSQASFRSPSATPSPPGSSWETKEMSTVQTQTHITSGAAR